MITKKHNQRGFDNFDPPTLFFFPTVCTFGFPQCSGNARALSSDSAHFSIFFICKRPAGRSSPGSAGGNLGCGSGVGRAHPAAGRVRKVPSVQFRPTATKITPPNNRTGSVLCIGPNKRRPPRVARNCGMKSSESVIG